jgi:hypothetical protein
MTAIVMLPNGTIVSCLQEHDAPFISVEVQSCFSRVVRLQPGDTVFDAGANIGHFSLAAMRFARAMCAVMHLNR